MALGVLSTAAYAQDNVTRFNVAGETGNSQFDITKIESIKFEGEKMIVTHSMGTDEFNFADVNKMFFDTVSGIEGVYDSDAEEGLHVSIKDGMLTATMPENDIDFRVFTFDGQLVDNVKANSDLTYSLAELPSGTYILLVNKKAIKFIR